MEGGIMFEALLQNQSLGFSSDGFDSPWIPKSFHDEKKNRKKSVSGQQEKEYNSDEDCFRQPEKKRRLTVDQVECLEKSFKEENKLEPERKIQLAKELDLQPRQVAIWFQNRRARCKTKQLEKDYDVLSSTYDKLKLEFDCLQKHNHNLKQEVETLNQRLYQREIGEKDSEFRSKLELDSNAQETNRNNNKVSLQTAAGINEPKMVICKQEYANSVSTKSDIIDSYSPDGNHYYSPILEPCDSSNNQSDFSQDEDDNLTCPKMEYESYIDPNDQGSLGYPIINNDQPFWLWP